MTSFAIECRLFALQMYDLPSKARAIKIRQLKRALIAARRNERNTARRVNRLCR